MFVLILFIISLVVLIALIGSHTFALRAGKVNFAIDPEVENPLSRSNLAVYKNEIYDFLEVRTRKITLYALKFSIRLGYSVKARLDSLVSGVHRKMATHERKLKQEENTEGKDTGAFLKTIGEYKSRITRVHKKKEKETIENPEE